MPEDQGVNGDRWTEQICRLFKKAGWIKIADSNIDIEGINGKPNGIDALFHYHDGFFSKRDQGIFVEAKYYATSSFTKSNLETWVLNLFSKIEKLKNSKNFVSNYPVVDKLAMTNGVVAIWFHDEENYQSIKNKINEALLDVRLPVGRKEKNLNFRIFVLDNEKILQIGSLLDTVERFKQSHSDSLLNFTYPSSAGLGNSGQELDVLNFEYMFSKFVLAKARKTNSPEITDIVFYFGEIDLISFERLREALVRFDMINKQNALVIYKYKRDDNYYRKLDPEVKKLFDVKKIEVKDMDSISALPSWVLHDE